MKIGILTGIALICILMVVVIYYLGKMGDCEKSTFVS